MKCGMLKLSKLYIIFYASPATVPRLAYTARSENVPASIWTKTIYIVMRVLESGCTF